MDKHGIDANLFLAFLIVFYSLHIIFICIMIIAFQIIPIPIPIHSSNEAFINSFSYAPPITP